MAFNVSNRKHPKTKRLFQVRNSASASVKTCKAVPRLTTALRHKNSRGQLVWLRVTREKMRCKQFRLKAHEMPRLFELNLRKLWKVNTIVIIPLYPYLHVKNVNLSHMVHGKKYSTCNVCLHIFNSCCWTMLRQMLRHDSLLCQTILHFFCIGTPAVTT